MTQEAQQRGWGDPLKGGGISPTKWTVGNDLRPVSWVWDPSGPGRVRVSGRGPAGPRGGGGPGLAWRGCRAPEAMQVIWRSVALADLKAMTVLHSV